MTTALDRHHRVAEMVHRALALGENSDVWIDLATVLEVRLTPHERRMLLVAVALSAEPDDALLVLDWAASALIFGAPLPVLDEIDEDARWWAENATLPELKAYLAATFVRLPPREKKAFLDVAKRRLAA